MTENQIDVGFRAYQYIRTFAIKDPLDAMVELFTNLDDAYRRTDATEKKAYLNVYRTQDGDEYIEVIDNAIGVPPEMMKEYFLSAGYYTNVEGSRGFFSTGAKNISAIGHVTFTSIKDGVISEVRITESGTTEIHNKDENGQAGGSTVTQFQRDILKIPENGLRVMIKLITSYKFGTITAIDKFLKTLPCMATLRDMMADPNYNFQANIRSVSPCLDTFDAENYSPGTDPLGDSYQQRLTYTYRDSTELLNVEFEVPNYPEYTARFVINKHDTPIPQPNKEACMEFGFLIKDSVAIHEVTTLGEDSKYRWNPNINYLSGYLKCDGIRDMLKKFDDPDNDSVRNPSPILDPSRITGINNEHPMIKSLYSVPRIYLEDNIKKLEKSVSIASINVQELDDIVRQLQDLGVDIFGQNEVEMYFNEDPDGDLAAAIQTVREEYTLSEINNQEVALNLDIDTTLTDKQQLTEDQIRQLSETSGGNLVEYIYAYDNNGNLVSIPKPPDNNYTQAVVDYNTAAGGAEVLVEPYIYRMNEGNLERVYIYRRGVIDRVTDPEKNYHNIRQKSLTIEFINDINLQHRYRVDVTDGIHIKINLHNPTVQDNFDFQKMMTTLGGSYAVDIYRQSSLKALYFLRDIMCDVFTEIILDSEILSNKITLTDNGAITSKKILEHRKDIMTRIEVPIFSLFAGYIANRESMIYEAVDNVITSAKDQLITLVAQGATEEEIEAGTNQAADSVFEGVKNILQG